MKKLVALFVVLLILVFVLFSNKRKKEQDALNAQKIETSKSTERKTDEEPFEEGSAFPSNLKTIEQKLAYIFEKPHSDNPRYKLIIHLLRTDEKATLEALSKMQFPDNLEPGTPKAEEIAMIDRAVIDVYMGTNMSEILSKLDVLRQTKHLHPALMSSLSNGVGTKGDTTTLYDWMQSNPTDAATLRMGVQLGGKLVDYDRDNAWKKTQELPAGDMRTGAFSSVLSTIASDDLVKAVDLINSVERTPDLDRSITNMIHQGIQQEYPHEELVGLAVSPVTQDFRTATMGSFFDDWARKDSAGLKKWAEQSHPYSQEIMDEINLTVKQALERQSTGE